MRAFLLALLSLFLLSGIALGQEVGPADAGEVKVEVPDVGPSDTGIVILAEIPKPHVPETPEEAAALVTQLLDVGQNGHWTVFGGLVLLLLVYLFNRLGIAARIRREFVPIFTMVLGCIMAIGVALAQGAPITEGITLGLLEGGVAIALWELVAKHITKNKSDGTPRKGTLEEPPLNTET